MEDDILAEIELPSQIVVRPRRVCDELMFNATLTIDPKERFKYPDLPVPPAAVVLEWIETWWEKRDTESKRPVVCAASTASNANETPCSNSLEQGSTCCVQCILLLIISSL
jgi:hypothetical protein